MVCQNDVSDGYRGIAVCDATALIDVQMVKSVANFLFACEGFLLACGIGLAGFVCRLCYFPASQIRWLPKLRREIKVIIYGRK